MTVLEVRDLVKAFPAGRRQVQAVRGVSFAIAAGETLALVGESGSGKSTIGRAVLRLIEPSGGRIAVLGQDITTMPERRLRPLRAGMQMVFQDPWSALNPRMSVGALLEEPLRLHTTLDAAARRARVLELAARIRLPEATLRRTLAGLSGGQLQRICIARAIATRPKLLVLDEPTSSLDLSVRAGILELLQELQRETGAAMLFITHDLSTVRRVADRVMVLYLGAVMETAPVRTLFDAPLHPYTQALLSAHLPADPAIRPRRHVLPGEAPSPLSPPPGCAFQPRCPVALPACGEAAPGLEAHGAAWAACIRVRDGGNRLGGLDGGGG